MCSPRLSLEGSGDRLISPGAHSPGKEGNIKKKKERREAEGAGCFAEHLPPAAESHSPSDKEKENSFHLELGLKCETRPGCGEISV